MATVKIACPQCVGQGLVGDPATRCPQCLGTGMISSDDTQSLATINSNNIGTNKVAVVVTSPPVISKSVTQIIQKGKN